jgi:hypothetical protein
VAATVMIPLASHVRRLSGLVRRYVDAVRTYNTPPTVSFDAERVRVVDAAGKDHGFAWDVVRRIGYRTLDSIGADHFLEFHFADGGAMRIALEWPGALKLSDHVDRLADTRIDPKRGHLANVTDDDSIIVWPSREAGGSLDEPRTPQA